MSTMQERVDMIEKSEKAGYHLSYTMYIMEDMIEFVKTTSHLPIPEQLEELKKHRWLNTDYFMPNAQRWLEICKQEAL